MENYLASTSTTAKSTSLENDQDNKHLIIDERGEKWLIRPYLFLRDYWQFIAVVENIFFGQPKSYLYSSE